MKERILTEWLLDELENRVGSETLNTWDDWIDVQQLISPRLLACVLRLQEHYNIRPCIKLEHNQRHWQAVRSFENELLEWLLEREVQIVNNDIAVPETGYSKTRAQRLNESVLKMVYKNT